MKIKTKGVQVSVSPKAHEKMLKEAFNAKPRLTLREFINIKNNIPKEE